MKEDENVIISQIKKRGESDPLILAVILFGSSKHEKFFPEFPSGRPRG